ncbi:MAG: divalent metal cation transporter [Flavobacteriales bacterium]|nr:divalent metal cation transporter [Flavobacteriales bacterium]
MNRNYLKALGPGILFASTCIGVSHLVQSTRAGADYGFTLVWAIILANLLKYPFFEYGSRYANATGTSLLDGYKKLGTWVLALYASVTIGSMFFVVAAVGAVTAGFLQNLFGIQFHLFGFNPFFSTTLIAFGASTIILLLGKYKVLDSMIKIIGAVLLLSTLAAFFLTLGQGQVTQQIDFIPKDIWTSKNVLFLIALMGWMPTAVDLSTWTSLWTVERIKQTGYHPKMKETLFDFNFGYITSAVLSICFVTLGAYLLFGSGKPIEQHPAKFANQVVNLYTDSIGGWSYYLIAVAAFAIMFGTCIAVLDGYARAMSKTTFLFIGKRENKKSYTLWLLISGIGGLGFIYYYLVYLASVDPEASKLGFKRLIDIATSISFIIAPVVAIANFVLVGKKHIGDHSPPVWLKILSYLGIIFLIGFSIFFFIGPGLLE